MRKSLAEGYPLSYICPLCEFLGDEQQVIDHLAKDHTDKEMIEITGWDLKDYKGDEK